jgi:predicted methyltransferase
MQVDPLPRIQAGPTCHRRYLGDGGWTHLFSGVLGPERRIYSFVRAEVAYFKNFPVSGMRALEGEPAREKHRRRVGGPRVAAEGYAASCSSGKPGGEP